MSENKKEIKKVNRLKRFCLITIFVIGILVLGLCILKVVVDKRHNKEIEKFDSIMKSLSQEYINENIEKK